MRTDRDIPGLGAYNIPSSIGHDSPKVTLKGKWPEKSHDVTPGPGAYNIMPKGTTFVGTT